MSEKLAKYYFDNGVVQTTFGVVIVDRKKFEMGRREGEPQSAKERAEAQGMRVLPDAFEGVSPIDPRTSSIDDISKELHRLKTTESEIYEKAKEQVASLQKADQIAIGAGSPPLSSRDILSQIQDRLAARALAGAGVLAPTISLGRAGTGQANIGGVRVGGMAQEGALGELPKTSRAVPTANTGKGLLVAAVTLPIVGSLIGAALEATGVIDYVPGIGPDKKPSGESDPTQVAGGGIDLSPLPPTGAPPTLPVEGGGTFTMTPEPAPPIPEVVLDPLAPPTEVIAKGITLPKEIESLRDRIVYAEKVGDWQFVIINNDPQNLGDLEGKIHGAVLGNKEAREDFFLPIAKSAGYYDTKSFLSDAASGKLRLIKFNDKFFAQNGPIDVDFGSIFVVMDKAPNSYTQQLSLNKDRDLEINPWLSGNANPPFLDFRQLSAGSDKSLIIRQAYVASLDDFTPGYDRKKLLVGRIMARFKVTFDDLLTLVLNNGKVEDTATVDTTLEPFANAVSFNKYLGANLDNLDLVQR